VISLKLFRLFFAVFCILIGGAFAAWAAQELTGMPDIFGILRWDILFVAIAGAAAYSALVSE
jgi:hypothetical protein